MKIREIKIDKFKRYGHASIIYKNYIVAHGGLYSRKRSDSIVFYDIINKNLSVENIESNIYTKRDMHNAVLYKGKMILTMGCDGLKWMNDIISFDLETKKFDIITPKNDKEPLARAGNFCALYKNKIYIGFGWNGSSCLTDIWYFDLDNLIWNQVVYNNDIIIEGRDSAACVLVDNDIYIFGGGNKKITYNQIIKFNLILNHLEYIKVPNHIDVGIAGCSCCYYDDNIYLLGGRINNKSMPNIVKMNVKSCVFENLKIDIDIGYASTANIINGIIYLMGGNGKDVHDKIYAIEVDDNKNMKNQNDKMFKLGSKYSDIKIIL